MISPRNLFDALGSQGLDPREYSGRGMYGRQCIAFDCDMVPEGYADLIEALSRSLMEVASTEDIAELIRFSRYDTCGLGMIIYFPRLEWHNSFYEEEPTE